MQSGGREARALISPSQVLSRNTGSAWTMQDMITGTISATPNGECERMRESRKAPSFMGVTMRSRFSSSSLTLETLQPLIGG